jgi:hypothetical protein
MNVNFVVIDFGWFVLDLLGLGIVLLCLQVRMASELQSVKNGPAFPDLLARAERAKVCRPG